MSADIDPSAIVPWNDEAEVVEAFLEKKGGEWVVAAAYLDYTYLTEVTAAIRAAFGVRRTKPLPEGAGAALLYADHILATDNMGTIDGVVERAENMVDIIPRGQHQDVLRGAKAFLNQTAGHYAVTALIDALEPVEQIPVAA